jgi:multidrug resistance efflux pump
MKKSLMRKPKPFKLLLSLVVLVLLIAGVVSSAQWWPSKSTLKLSGEVQAKEIRNGSRFGGRVKQVLVQEGQVVKPGDLLIVFDDTDLQAKIADAKATLSQAIAQERMMSKGADIGQVRQAGAAVKQAQERLKMVSNGARPEEIAQGQSRLQAAETQAKQAHQAAENAKVMLDEGIISKQKYDALQGTLATANSNVDAARAALNMMKSGGRPEEKNVAGAQLSAAKAQYNQVLRGARPEEVSIASANVEKARSALQALEAQLAEVRIKAPFPGYVSVVGVTQGELVAPGRSVITIIDYSHLWTDIFVPESKLLSMSLQPGDVVTIKPRSDQKSEFQGKVALINPKSEFIPNSGGDSSTEEQTFRVKVNIADKDVTGQKSLYPGMKVDIFFAK